MRARVETAARGARVWPARAAPSAAAPDKDKPAEKPAPVPDWQARMAALRERGSRVPVLVLTTFDDDELVAIAFLVPMGGRLEFCLTLRAGARARMLPLCRYAHLTLSRLAETGAVITCHVWAGNTAGQRMAREGERRAVGPADHFHHHVHVGPGGKLGRIVFDLGESSLSPQAIKLMMEELAKSGTAEVRARHSRHGGPGDPPGATLVTERD